jgi:ketosteroid isomerase-like protein
MTEEIIESLRAVVDAFNQGDIDGAVANVAANAAPDFEYVSAGTVGAMEGVYRGPDGYRRFLEGFWDPFEDARVEVDDVMEAADQVLISLTLRGRGKQSGVEASWKIFQLWTMREGKFVRGQAFTSREEALEAAGLAE